MLNELQIFKQKVIHHLEIPKINLFYRNILIFIVCSFTVLTVFLHILEMFILNKCTMVVHFTNCYGHCGYVLYKVCSQFYFFTFSIP